MHGFFYFLLFSNTSPYTSQSNYKNVSISLFSSNYSAIWLMSREINMSREKIFVTQKIFIFSQVAESAKRENKPKIDKEAIKKVDKPAERFTKATAKKFGVSESTVKAHTQVGV